TGGGVAITSGATQDLSGVNTYTGATTIAALSTLTLSGNGSIASSSGVNLTGTNTYTGGTTINAGLINFNSLGNFGSGNITLNGGGLQWASGNTTDVSSRLVMGAGGATFDTGGNNITLSGS